MKLQLEVNEKFSRAVDQFVTPTGKALLITPPLDGEYWVARVKVSENQAVVAFPKFTTIGIGFQHEEDWNTNLPYSCEAKEIFNHIDHNKGSDDISDEHCIEAIKMLQGIAPQFLG